MAVSKRLRFEILRRDNHTCRYCGATAPDVPLRIDHVIPVSLGGTDDPSNLVTACDPCNSGKTSSTPDAPLVANVADDALRWAAAMEKAAENMRAQESVKLAYREAFLAEWNRWGIGQGEDRRAVELPNDWKTSLERFRLAGLPAWMWAEIVDVAMGRDKVKPESKFKYCCGIAWNKVTELQNQAKAIVRGAAAEPAPLDPVVQAALAVWENEQFDQISTDQRERVIASATQAIKTEDAHRIIQAAQQAAWCGEDDIETALVHLDQESALRKWTFAWYAKSGEWPDDERIDIVRKKIEALLSAGVYITRVEQAALYAGSRCSVRLYFGLGENELEEIKESDLLARAVEEWKSSFCATAGRWPSRDETSAFFDRLRKLGKVAPEGLLVADVYAAAAAAGAYQDPDITSCLPRRFSAFEAAANPLVLPPDSPATSRRE